ncbi:major facilitator superfamily domain-containing protein, partial [Tribonema minus]
MAEGVRRRRKEQQEQQQQQQQVNGFKHEQEAALLDEFSSGSEDDGPATLPQNHHLESGLRQAWSSSAKEWAAVVFSPRNVVTLVYALSYTLSIPVLPFMARRHLYGYRDEFVGPDGKVMIDESPGVPEAWRGIGYGCVMSGYYATKMIAAPLIGFLSDRVGRKMLLVVTFLGSCVTFTLTCLMGRHSLHGLVLCRLLLGCFAANGALMMAYIRDSVPREAQASAFAQHSAAWGMAYVVATPLLAALREDPVRCLVLAAVCMALAALLV